MLIGVALGCAVAAWLAVELETLADLRAWAKYRTACVFATIPGLGQAQFRWTERSGRGETLITAQQLAESPSLRPWAAAVG